MRPPHRLIGAALTCAVVIATSLTGCGPRGPVWVDERAAYTAQSIETVFDVADTTQLAESPTTDAPALRHGALTALRKNGDEAAAVADLLTRTFASDTRGVPVYVELASVDGTAAVIVVEATGPKSGRLNSKRLWALGTNGDVILARGR